MIEVKCAICKNNKNTKVLYKSRFIKKKLDFKTFSARRTPDRLHYRLVKCKTCGLIFSNPILDKNEINKLYFKSDFNYNLESEYLRKTYFKYLAEYFSIKDIKTKKILEIGCGNGFFLEELQKNGIDNVYGIEPGKESVEKANLKIKRRIKIDILKKDIFPNESFDVILCFHTLDHIPEPNEFLKLVYSLLKRNGKIFFFVHNTNGLSVKLLKEKSPIFDIEHIYLFNNNNLRQIFIQNKFKSPEVFDIKNSYPIRYWIRLFPINSFLKIRLINFLQFLKLDLIRIKLNAGNIGIIASK
nr:class I SAM-dependent methyltransferase [Candidatus Levybacteria bacterium]